MVLIEKDVIMVDKQNHVHAVTPRTRDEKIAVINRLKRIEGQVRGIQKNG